MSNERLLFEIGTEEIPAAALYAATKQLAELAGEAFDKARIPYGSIATYSTPRRIILVVEEVESATQPLTTRAKGPAAAIAFDEAGTPTKAAIGFARGKGIEPSQLVGEEDENGKEYVYAVVEKPAIPVVDLLPELLQGLICALSWPRSQRWGSGHVTFSRPVRWLVALLGDKIVSVEFAGLVAGRTTRGHRLIANREFTINNADEFPGFYEQMWVVPSAKKRAQLIRGQINAIESQTGLKADTPKKVFEEVVNLVEYPTVLLAHFDERFLDVPPEIITDAMLSHQRYFPMYRPDGTLDSAFLVVSNGNPEYCETIAEGNERVVRARLDDAAFFVAEDLRKPLQDYVDGLENVVFQEQLGSVKAKVERIVSNAGAICDLAGISGQEKEDTLRAALLAKADLITSAVVEFTELQGIMGGHYAKAAGETQAVADAITDHYKPRFAGDELARNALGKVVAVADKLDTICGIFAIDQGPTGSSDPFALRRSAIGIINTLLGGLNVSLSASIDAALDAYEGVVEFDRELLAQTVREFFTTRLEVIALDKGYPQDAISAVTAIGMFEPVETLARIQALVQAREAKAEVFEDLATAYTRAANLADPSLGCAVDVSLFGEHEQALFDAVQAADQAVTTALDQKAHAACVEALATLRGPIDRFFEEVMVMDEDVALRENRLRLLNSFVAVFARVADIGKLGK